MCKKRQNKKSIIYSFLGVLAIIFGMSYCIISNKPLCVYADTESTNYTYVINFDNYNIYSLNEITSSRSSPEMFEYYTFNSDSFIVVNNIYSYDSDSYFYCDYILLPITTIEYYVYDLTPYIIIEFSSDYGNDFNLYSAIESNYNIFVFTNESISNNYEIFSLQDLQYFETYYSFFSTVNATYTTGYNAGYSVGYNDSQTAKSSFSTLLDSIFTSPKNLLDGVFNFTIFGINVKYIVFFFLSISVVFVVFKFFRK